ncbi:MAG: nucleoside-diphosphate kinase [Patescibacteria group bacterium]
MLKKERTLIAIKPESIQRHLIGEFVSKFERRGLKLIACKLIVPAKEQIAKHYPDDEEWYISCGTKTLENYKARGIDPGMGPIELAKLTRQRLIDHFTDRPLLLMIWEGPHAVSLGRKTAGATNPLIADIGSIRGDYSMESYELADDINRPVHTLIHASASTSDAEKEIKVWFEKREILDYELVTETVFYTKDWGRVKKTKN